MLKGTLILCVYFMLRVLGRILRQLEWKSPEGNEKKYNEQPRKVFTSFTARNGATRCR